MGSSHVGPKPMDISQHEEIVRAGQKRRRGEVQDEATSRINELTKKVLEGLANPLEVSELTTLFQETSKPLEPEAKRATQVVKPQANEVEKACERIVVNLLPKKEILPNIEHQMLLKTTLLRDTQSKQKLLEERLYEKEKDETLYPVLIDGEERLSILPGDLVNLINQVLYQERENPEIPKLGQKAVFEYFAHEINAQDSLTKKKAIDATLDMIKNFDATELPKLDSSLAPPEVFQTILGPLLDDVALGSSYKALAPYGGNDQDGLAMAIIDRINTKQISLSDLGFSLEDELSFLKKYGTRLSHLTVHYRLYKEPIETILSYISLVPNIKSLKLMGSFPELMEEIIKKLPNIEKIRFGHRVEDFTGLLPCTKLTELHLDHHDSSEKHDRELAQIIHNNPNLRSITIIGIAQQKVLQELRELKKLSYLFLWGPADTETFLDIIRNNPDLEFCRVNHLPTLSGLWREEIPELPKLQNLDMSWCDCGFQILSKVPNIKVFSGIVQDVDDETEKKLPIFTKLQKVSVHPGTTEQGIATLLRHAPVIEALSIAIIHLSFSEVPNLDTLKYLKMRFSPEESIVSLVSKTKDLQVLDLTCNNLVTGELFGRLTSLTHIEILGIAGTNCRDPSLLHDFILRNPNLKKIYFTPGLLNPLEDEISEYIQEVGKGKIEAVFSYEMTPEVFPSEFDYIRS